ncbi:MAG: hypothetical protein AAGC77_01655, partial [Pseudomonadota bacterium]
IRTGMGALPNNNSWQLYKFGFGPYIDTLFTQSDLGVITKVGIWLMPAPPPPGYKPFMITMPSMENLAMAVEIMAPMKVNMVIGNTVMISSPLQDIAPYASRSEFSTEAGIDAAAAAETYGLGQWNLYGALYGMPQNVEAVWSMIEPAFNMIPGAKIYLREDRPDDVVWRNREKMMRGEPVQGMDNIANWSGNDVISLGVTAPIAGADAMRLHGVSASILSKHGFDYLAEYAVAWRSLTKRINLPVDRTDGDSLAAAEACAQELVFGLAAQGFGVTNTSTGYRPMALQPYTEGGLADLRSQLKTTLDPHGVFPVG